MVSVFRYVLFVPTAMLSLSLTYGALYFIQFYFFNGISWVEEKIGTFWLCAILLVGGISALSALWIEILSGLTMGIQNLAKRSPSYKFASWIIILFSLVLSAWCIYAIWQSPIMGIRYIIECACGTFFVFALTSAFYYSLYMKKE